MNTESRLTPFLVGAAVALMLTFSTAAVYPAVSQAADSVPVPAASTTDIQMPPAPGGDVGRRPQEAHGENETYLAEALGITVEELQAAYIAAGDAAIDQAVEQDLLTETQADELRQRLENASAGGFGWHGGDRGLFGSDTIDSEALLADALGITVDELQAACDEAQAAVLAQAVAGGQMTQEQADLMAAQRTFQEYVRTQQPTYEAEVQAAAAAGAITQEQADLLLENQDSFGGKGDAFFAPGLGGGRGQRLGGRP